MALIAVRADKSPFTKEKSVYSKKSNTNDVGTVVTVELCTDLKIHLIFGWNVICVQIFFVSK